MYQPRAQYNLLCSGREIGFQRDLGRAVLHPDTEQYDLSPVLLHTALIFN